MNRTYIKILVVALALAGHEMNANADSLPEGVQVHGFASQAVISTDHNNFFGNTENKASLDFTELGANISWRLNPSLQLSAQAVSRRAGETDNGSPRIDYATADYTIHASENTRFGLYLGKIKNPYGLYNETRDVAFTRPSILLPQSIYLDRIRNFVLSAPGMAVYGESVLPIGNLSYQFGVTRPDTSDRETEGTFLGKDRPGKLKSDAFYIGRILLEPGNGHFKLALTGVSMRAHYQPGAPDALLAGNIHFDAWVLSGQYNAENWVFTSEYAQNHINAQNFGAFLLNRAATGSSYYVQGTYRLTPRWSALARYDVTYRDNNDKDGQAFSALIGVPAYSRFAKDLTAGLSYELSNNWLLRGEFHHVDGTAWLPYSDNPNPAATSRHWNMWLFQAAYRF
ncbi:hypothetical protein SFMTTN_2437 [Sulfuriferula multivorans]|uniref:Porin n=1 Tax=Sulfuriferula multivorans TaxID=1559896 RepID=A0A401JG54_9PROT|nr:porin [Sulfuriferula multivorans]GBL46621.1 hypothetical protein SFMTTN_2437 [Sulfuriferula multivorans]